MTEDDGDVLPDATADPYQWLEHDDREVRQWVSRQNEDAERVLDRQVREYLSTRIEALQESITRETTDTNNDSNGESEAQPESSAVEWSYPSPDKPMVARVIDDPDTKGKTIRIVDSRGTVVTERTGLSRVPPPLFAWTTDGFYYVTTGDGADDAHIDRSIRYADLDGSDRIVTADITPAVWPHLSTDASTGRLLVTMSDEATADNLYVLEDGELEPVIVDRDAEFKAFSEDGTVYLYTTFDAPQKRLLACPVDELASTPPEEMREVVPETHGVIETFDVMGNRVVVHRLVDACSELVVYDATGEGRLVSRFDVPPFSSVSDLRDLDDEDVCSFQIESFDHPPTPVRGVLPTGRTEVRDQSKSGLPDLTVTREWADSSDGVEVPVFVVHRADLDPDGDVPTFLHGYGAHRVNVVPNFDVARVPFLEDGGVYAQVCARGGSEFGEPWHQAGMREQKQQTFDDFIAATELLIDRGYTSPDHLGAHGHSSGGLAVGAVITQRPELFSVAVARAPLMDMLRFHHFPHGETMATEFGSPDDEDAYRYLREYSPYHNIAERDYPAVLFCINEEDPRVHPSHARKITARLQEHARSHPQRPIVLRTYEGNGHSLSNVDVDLDVWTFVFDQLGLR